MSQVNISYKTAKALKEFLGEAAPDPIAEQWYNPSGFRVNWSRHGENYPIYQLHDLLSKPFCEAFIKERFARSLNHSSAAWEVIGYIEQVVNAYYNGGLPAVESALIQMMEGK